LEVRQVWLVDLRYTLTEMKAHFEFPVIRMHNS
jgi:hypothetical protein